MFLESQPIAAPDQHWRVVDPARGQQAEGHEKAQDLVEHQPWSHDVPLQVAPAPT